MLIASHLNKLISYIINCHIIQYLIVKYFINLENYIKYFFSSFINLNSVNKIFRRDNAYI